MTQHLFRLAAPLSESGLIESLRHPEKIPVIEVDHDVDLSGLDVLIRDLNSRGAGDAAIDSELAAKPGTPAKKRAAEIFADMMTREDFQEFLTTAAYQDID